jgi:type II secretory pathway pseudopilin PulG
MRNIILAAAAAAVAIPVAAPAVAQQTRREAVNDVRRDCNEQLRYARSRSEYRRIQRQCKRDVQQVRRDWRQYRNYDYNRYEPGANGYYADQYYRDGRYYQERRLSRNDRIYRGQNGQYYCRRPDGTTGLIVGGAVGALLGNAIDGGRSSILGTLIGGGVGAALGREVERGNVRCR